MKITDEEGKVWQILGYDYVKSGAYYLYENGPRKGGADHGAYRLALRAVPTIHEFGGVKFEETGDKRKPEVGEWFTNELGYPVYTGHPHYGQINYIILRPLHREE